METHVFFRGRLPTRAALSCAMKERRFPFSITSAVGSRPGTRPEDLKPYLTPPLKQQRDLVLIGRLAATSKPYRNAGLSLVADSPKL
jgi:hypothetical protein